MTDEDASLDRNEAWALIFNTLGEERCRSMLLGIVRQLQTDDGLDRSVLEVRAGGDGATVLDITDHVESLEDELDTNAGSRPVKREDTTTEL